MGTRIFVCGSRARDSLNITVDVVLDPLGTPSPGTSVAKKVLHFVAQNGEFTVGEKWS